MTSFEGLGNITIEKEDNYFLSTCYINKASDLLLYLILRKSKLINPLKVCAEQGCEQFHLGKQISHLSIFQMRKQLTSVKWKHFPNINIPLEKTAGTLSIRRGWWMMSINIDSGLDLEWVKWVKVRWIIPLLFSH